MNNNTFSIRDIARLLDALQSEQHGRDAYISNHLKQVKALLKKAVDHLTEAEREIDSLLQVVETPAAVDPSVRWYEE
jgi:predicted  nucleic acid-binding Zn-ribbon protein